MKSKFFILFFLIVFSVSFSSAISITMHVPEKYNTVVAGERLYFEVSVKYPENPTRIDLRLSYEIKDENGNIVAQAKALKAVETQASFIDYIVLPDKLDSGVYSIDVKINDYGDMEEVVGTTFQVSTSKEERIMTYIYVIIIGMVFLSILVTIDLLRRRYR